MDVYRYVFKPIFDVIISVIALIIVLPVILVTTIVLFFENNGKVFFLQERPGRFGNSFKIIKFKSMTDTRDSEGNLLPDNLRITSFGRIIRKWSIDELPQLFNVIKGDMSLIGPRPLLFKYIPLYNERQKRRMEVKPGITGWAQVNGRNSISWEEKFEKDLYYVENMSFLLDLRIIYLTVLKVIKRQGINQADDQPMLPFLGNK